MKTPKKNRDEVRAYAINIPMTKAEKERIATEAHRCGLPVSSFVRMIVSRYIDDKHREMM